MNNQTADWSIVDKRKALRIGSIDLLRGAAILYIVAVRHLDDYAGNIYRGHVDDILTESYLGLLVFISGYLLSINNSDINSIKDAGRFYCKRFIRIYPLYILALLSYLLLSISKGSIESLTIKSFFMHSVFLNMLTGNSVLTLWFVSMVCLFYMIYPVVIYKYSIFRTVFIFIIINSSLIVIKKEYGWIDSNFILYMPFFFLGIISLKHNLVEKVLTSKMILAASGLTLIVASLLQIYMTNYISKMLFMILSMVSSLPGLFWLGQYFSKTIRATAYQKIAYASFCMYLFHRVIYHLLMKVHSSQDNLVNALYLTFIGIPIIYGISYMLQKRYDRLIMHWKLL